MNPSSADAHHSRGNVLRDLNRHAEALESYDCALALKPDYASAYNNRGNVLRALNRHAEALESYERALALKPDYVNAHNNRGTVLRDLNRRAEALESYERALALKPDSVESLNNRGIVLRDLNRHAEALDSYEQALALKPDYAEAHNNRGVVLRDLKRFAEALESYGRALALKPDYAEAYNNRGNVMCALKRYPEALEAYERALQLKPDSDFLYGDWLYTRMQICDWSDEASYFVHLFEKIEHYEKASQPFPVLAMPSSLALQRRVAEIWVQDRHPANSALPRIAKRPRHHNIRIGYFSADFHGHATSHLMAELFERHDKSKFQLTGFSFGPDRDDAMRRRVSAAFDRFIDVRSHSDTDVAMLARELEIDIAVDLKGFTQDSRTDIFATRAAPIQVNYLGYPGTMGADYIDYLIADTTLIPGTHQQYYAEKIVYLPDSYQPNDSKRYISGKVFTREQLGLPRRGFVFCCFNSNYKINAGLFDRWMRVLNLVEGSVLWLLEDNDQAANNLRKEAVCRGVSADRLIFAPRMPLPEHLARHCLADLFLDTLPCNAHTTASDALWAGLPVLTCLGATFAGRVGASLLNGIRLPELIADTPEQYEGLALALATDPNKLGEIKQKLADNRLTTPLFDIRLFTRRIEAAYTRMYERYQADLPPEHIYVQG